MRPPGIYRWLSRAHQDVIRYLAAEADGVIVSSPPLARQMEAFNRLVLELPNAVDERLFPPDGGNDKAARRAAGRFRGGCR